MKLNVCRWHCPLPTSLSTPSLQLLLSENLYLKPLHTQSLIFTALPLRWFYYFHSTGESTEKPNWVICSLRKLAAWLGKAQQPWFPRPRAQTPPWGPWPLCGRWGPELSHLSKQGANPSSAISLTRYLTSWGACEWGIIRHSFHKVVVRIKYNVYGALHTVTRTNEELCCYYYYTHLEGNIPHPAPSHNLVLITAENEYATPVAELYNTRICR